VLSAPAAAGVTDGWHPLLARDCSGLGADDSGGEGGQAGIVPANAELNMVRRFREGGYASRDPTVLHHVHEPQEPAQATPFGGGIAAALQRQKVASAARTAGATDEGSEGGRDRGAQGQGRGSTATATAAVVVADGSVGTTSARPGALGVFDVRLPPLSTECFAYRAPRDSEEVGPSRRFQPVACVANGRSPSAPAPRPHGRWAAEIQAPLGTLGWVAGRRVRAPRRGAATRAALRGRAGQDDRSAAHRGGAALAPLRP
jgi:hypothetical protein